MSICLDLSKGKIGFSIKCEGQFGSSIESNSNIYECTCAFGKGFKELLFENTHTPSHFKSCVLKKLCFGTSPNSYIIFLVSKSTFYLWKVQANGH